MTRLIARLRSANWRDSAAIYAVGVTILAVGFWWLVGIWPDRDGLWVRKSPVFTVISPLAPFTAAVIAYRLTRTVMPLLQRALLTSLVALLIGFAAFLLLKYVAGIGDGFDRMGWDYLGNLATVPIFWAWGLLVLTFVDPAAPAIALTVTTGWTLLYLALRRRPARLSG